MNKLNGGYIMIDLSLPKSELISQLENALKMQRPILVYGDDGADYMSIRKNNNTYILENSKSIVVFNPQVYAKPYKTTKNVDGTLALEFNGPKIINAEIHDAYILLTISFWYSDENENALNIDGNAPIATFDFGENNLIADSIMHLKYSDFYAYYDANGGVVSDADTFDVIIDGGTIEIDASTTMTIEKDSYITFKCVIYRY